MPDESIGTQLRNARLQRGLTLEQAANDTRISQRFLEALEADRFEEIPAPVYVRGFIRSYAGYLQLNSQPLIALLSGAEAPQDPYPTPPPAPPPPAPTTALRPPRRQPQPPPAPRRDFADDAESEPIFEDEPPYSIRRGRDRVGEPISGILSERPQPPGSSGGPVGYIVIAAAVLIILVLVGVVLAFNRGGDNVPALASTPQPTAARSPAAIIPVGTPSATRDPLASPSPSGTPGTPTGTPGTTTPTAEPTQVPATSTPVPPTPVPPTPTPEPELYVPFEWEECAPDCVGTLRIVCVPSGGWFVDALDKNGQFPAESLGWTVKYGTTLEARFACRS